MSQIEKVEIPFDARKNLVLTRLARSSGFVAALSIGLALFKIPKDKILLAGVLVASVEIVSAGIEACDDNAVKEEMNKETFGTTNEKLEAAGQGLGVGFVAVAACAAFVKFTKGKDDGKAD